MHWQIGDVKITRLREQEPIWAGTMITKSATADTIKGEGEWLAPFTDNTGKIKLSIHSLLVESEGRRILVDTCVGNDKPRPGFADFNNLHTPFLADMEKAGVPRDSVDTVICTHLHLDHVGWNTMLVNGRWVPPFPKAKYMMCSREWDHWSKYDGSPDFQKPIEDSVRPVIEAGLAELVEPASKLASHVRLEGTPRQDSSPHPGRPSGMDLRVRHRSHDGVRDAQEVRRALLRPASPGFRHTFLRAYVRTYRAPQRRVSLRAVAAARPAMELPAAGRESRRFFFPF